MLAQTPDCVGPRVSKRQPLRLVGAQAEAEAEVAMRGRCAVCAKDATISGWRGLIGTTEVPTLSPGTAAPTNPASEIAS